MLRKVWRQQRRVHQGVVQQEVFLINVVLSELGSSYIVGNHASEAVLKHLAVGFGGEVVSARSVVDYDGQPVFVLVVGQMVLRKLIQKRLDVAVAEEVQPLDLETGDDRPLLAEGAGPTQGKGSWLWSLCARRASRPAEVV